MDEYALEMGSGTHHIYKDETGFEYNICLARVVDIHTNKNDFFHLKIYESNALPHLYAALARYRRPGTSAVEILAPVASFFDEAFAKFRRQFERKTGVKWEDRLDAVAVKEGGGGGGGGGGIVEERYFYRPPPAAGRKGRGVLPEGKTVVLVEVETARAAIVAEENAQDTTASEQGDAEERNSETSDQSPDEDSQSAAAAAAADDDDDNSDSEEEDESEDTNPKARSPPATDSFYTWHENFVAY
ncbi:MAG: hypothetical protein M1840_005422 [Geoglossum simile]|nr:MAG: hypothetical protein M1840_005422 [Geoglossum simile]